MKAAPLTQTNAGQVASLFTAGRTPILQRACACGQHNHAGGECAECKKKRLKLQRSATSPSSYPGGGWGEGQAAPPIVHEVLRSPGQPLDPATRAFMEPRFGHDFSQVRVHTDVKAVESAQAVNALAYTVGREVVFGTGEFAPRTNAGQRLLAHELAHVVQQDGQMPTTSGLAVSQPGQPLEREAEADSEALTNGNKEAAQPGSLKAGQSPGNQLFRRVATRLVNNCPPNTNNAPGDPVAAIRAIDARAGELAISTAQQLALEAAFIEAGLRDPASPVEVAFENRFGLPPAQGPGFLNRLTGEVRPTQDVALAEEMELMSRRFTLIATFFSQFVQYRCDTGALTYAGCDVAACAEDDFARACADVGAIFICPDFWPDHSLDEQAGVFIHEAGHIIWRRVIHGAGGPGGRFRHAECYTSFVADLAGFEPIDPHCPILAP